MAVARRPLVSVITPTKNRLALLIETMDSVAAQSLADWEHIIVDDGSDDGTAEEVGRRAAADPRVRYLARSGSKTGANVCRNQGVSAAEAQLVIFLDSDDLLDPHCLKRRVEIMQRNADLDFAVFSSGLFQRQAGDLPGVYHPMEPGDDLLRFLSHECIWQTTGPIWRKPFLEYLGAFDESLLSMQDLELHVRALSNRPRYVHIKEIDNDIRSHSDSGRTSTRHFSDVNFFYNAEIVRAKLVEVVRSRGLLTWSRRRALTGLCFATAERWARFGNARTAAAVWSKGRRDLSEPWLIWATGFIALCAVRAFPGEEGIVSRALNKWKGIVRFRQEPKLMPKSRL
jgi:glycosyltransferase involved in cell wall biosynthesis